MTVPAHVGHVEYLGDGADTTFDFGFAISTGAELEVRVANVIKTQDTHYTLSINGSLGGTVTFTAGNTPASGVVVSLRRVQPYEQLLDLVPNAALPAAALETRLDNIVKMIQRINEELSRRPALIPGSANSLRDLTLPVADGGVLAWNSDSTGLTTVSTSSTSPVTDLALIDDESGNVTEMRQTTDPGESGSENSQTTAAGEVRTLRHAILETKQAIDPSITYWYETPYGMKVFNVKTYGALGDNSTNDRVAINTCIQAAKTAGGGLIFFPPGTYYVTGSGGTQAVDVPASNADFTPASENHDYSFYIEDATGLHFYGPGATIRCDSNAGEIFLFNGARDITWDGIGITSTCTYDAAGTISVTGKNCLGFTSMTRDSERITIRNCLITAGFTGIYIFGSPASSYRVRNVTIENYLAVNTRYGLATHDNGYNITAQFRTVGGLRSYFAYGVYNHKIHLVVDTGSPDVQSFAAVNVKAYDVNTENVDMTVRYNRVSTSSKIRFESQHNLVAQPTAARVRNISLNYNEQGFSGGGGVAFGYYQDAAIQATSSTAIFDNFTLRGVFENDILADTTFTGNGRVKINVQDVVYISGTHSILNGKGFYTHRYNTYTPALKINGDATGITYSARVGEYFEIGNMVFGTADVTLSNKGASTGAVTLSLPRALGAYTSNSPIVQVIAYDAWTGLTGTVQAFVNTGADPYCTFLQTAADGRDPVDETHLTNTSRVIISFCYPK